MEGWSDTEPKGGEALVLNLRTYDTRGTETTHDTKRPLKGFKRNMIGEQLSSDFGSNWRRKNVSDLEFGCFSPPNFYTLNTLSKAKQQFKDFSLGIVEKCPIKSLVEFKHNSTHDTDNIYNWLWRWKKMVIRCPHEAVCDYSQTVQFLNKMLFNFLITNPAI